MSILSLLPSIAYAQEGGGTAAAGFDTSVIDWAIEELCGHITGNLGGLLVTVAAFGAIVSAALGSFRVTYSAIIVAVGAYAISSIESLYFPSAATVCASGASADVDGGDAGPATGGPVAPPRLSTSAQQTAVSERNTLYKDKVEENDPFAKLD